MPDIRGGNDAVRLWDLQGQGLGRQEHIAVQLAGCRRGCPGTARLGPEATAEPQRGIGEGQIASRYGAAERRHPGQAHGVAHPL